MQFLVLRVPVPRHAIEPFRYLWNFYEWAMAEREAVMEQLANEATAAAAAAAAAFSPPITPALEPGALVATKRPPPAMTPAVSAAAHRERIVPIARRQQSANLSAASPRASRAGLSHSCWRRARRDCVTDKAGAARQPRMSDDKNFVKEDCAFSMVCSYLFRKQTKMMATAVTVSSRLPASCATSTPSWYAAAAAAHDRAQPQLLDPGLRLPLAGMPPVRATLL